jgi:hypothetical protein
MADRYYSNGGLGPLVAEIISIKNGKVKIGYWNSDSKAAKPRVKITELPKSAFFSERCGWQPKPQQLTELETDPHTRAVIADVVAGRIAKREAKELLGCSPEWMNYLCRKLSKQLAVN